MRRSHRERHKMCVLHKSNAEEEAHTVLIISSCFSDFKERINKVARRGSDLIISMKNVIKGA